MSSSSIATQSSAFNLFSLPDDLVLNCLARVSRLNYPILSLVSKKFCSLVASKELYEIRKHLGCTESFLYVCLRFPPEYNPRWFTLWWRPTRTPNRRWFSLWWRPTRIPNPKPTLVSVPTRNYSPLYWWDVIAVGSNIYMIGEHNKLYEPSSRVFIMDCLSHTWREASSMLVTRVFPKVSVLDGKIYVAGGIDSSKWMECFDPKTEEWKDVASPNVEMRMKYIRKSLAIEGNLYLVGDMNLVYKPKEDKWDAIGSKPKVLDTDRRSSICVIDNVLYGHVPCKSTGIMLEWYDFEGRSWRVLKGLEKLPKLQKGSCVKLVNCGGKIAVLWDEYSSGFVNIWCAEIALDKRNRQVIYGKIEWCHLVLTVPYWSVIHNFTVVTV